MRQAGSVEMFDIRQHTAFTVIEGVIVGAANQIDAEPFQVLKQIWIGRHEGALRNSGRALVPIVHGTFEIGEGGVGAAQNFAQAKKRGSVKGVSLRVSMVSPASAMVKFPVSAW